MTLDLFLKSNGVVAKPRISSHARWRFVHRFHGTPKAQNANKLDRQITQLLRRSELIKDDVDGQHWAERESGLVIVTKLGEQCGNPRLHVLTVYHRPDVYR